MLIPACLRGPGGAYSLCNEQFQQVPRFKNGWCHDHPDSKTDYPVLKMCAHEQDWRSCGATVGTMRTSDATTSSRLICGGGGHGECGIAAPTLLRRGGKAWWRGMATRRDSFVAASLWRVRGVGGDCERDNIPVSKF